MKVELESGVWIAEGEGDPARTVKEENAREFMTLKEACAALTLARKYKPFPTAVVTS